MSRSSKRLALAAPLCALASMITAASPVDAASANATVEGRVRLPDGGIKEPEAQYVGYIDRIPNPIAELRAYDPRPECFVYLEGGTPGPDASKPDGRPVTLTVASGFALPILPVVVGTSVEIKNNGRATHPLYVVGQPDLISAEPLGPGGTRSFTAKDAGKAIVIRSKDMPHVETRVVALPTRYFAPLKRDGSFSIPDVPPGKWTLKIWYRDGWLPVTKSIDVAPKMEKPEIRLPDRLEPPDAQKAK
jgi:hypothetical protein